MTTDTLGVLRDISDRIKTSTDKLDGWDFKDIEDGGNALVKLSEIVTNAIEGAIVKATPIPKETIVRLVKEAFQEGFKRGPGDVPGYDDPEWVREEWDTSNARGELAQLLGERDD